MTSAALYAGSFDPPTNGHLDVARSALTLCDRLVVAVGVHHGKAPLLPAEERRALLLAVLAPLEEGTGVPIEVVTFDGLTTEAARRHGCALLVRGLRDGTDLDYEMQLAGMNAVLAPEVRTVFLPASAAARPITATLVRQVAALGGDVSPFVPAVVAAALRRRFPPSA